MELDRLLLALMRRSYLVIAFAGVGLLGAWVYSQLIGPVTASTTVAVLEPAAARTVSPGQAAATAGQAELTFNSVIQSRILAERVIDKLGLNITPDALQGKISIKIATSQVPNLTSPLYTIRVTDRDSARAVELADAVVAEGKQVFAELNTPDRTQADAALDQDERQLREQVNTERAKLQTQLTQAETELVRLRNLLPEYSRLSFDVTLQGSNVSQLAGRENELIETSLGGTPADIAKASADVADAQAKLDADRAALEKSKAGPDPNIVAQSKAAVAEQVAKLDSLQNGARPEQKDVLQKQVDAARNALYAAQTKRDGDCNKANPDYVCSAANAVVAQAQTSLETAIKQYRLSTAPPTATELQQAQAAVDQAQARLDAAQERETPLELQKGQSRVDASNKAIQAAQARRDALSPAKQAQALASVRGAKAIAATNLQSARDALAAFQQSNGVGELPTEITAQETLVSDLRRQLQGSASTAGALRGAEDHLNQLQTRRVESLIDLSGASSVQLKVLDRGSVKPSLFTELMVYGLGALLGVFLAIALVYLLEYFDRSPRSALEAGQLVGAPVLVRIPHA